MELKSNNIAVLPRTVFYPVKRKGEHISLERGGTLYTVKQSAAGKKDISAEKARLKKAAQGFEAIFIRKLLGTMRSSMSDNSMYGKGVEGDLYGDIIDNAIADVMSERSVLGLGDMLYRNMVKSLGIDHSHESKGKIQPQNQIKILTGNDDK